MIVIEHINYTIGKKILLNQIDLSIQTGKFIAIVGPNGAGKSTLLSVIANEIKNAHYSNYTFKDKNISQYTKDEIPKHRAKFSQHHANEIHLPITDIVMMGRYPYFSQDPNSSDIEIVNKWMQKTETENLIDRNYEQLSGGEKQRLHLARVMAQLENDIEKKLVLLDEPLNNLDVAHQFKTLHLIKNFTHKQNTALVVIHDLNMATQFADEIILMNHGKVVSVGTPEKILTEELLTEIYNYPCSIIEHPKRNRPIILFG